MSRLLGFVTIVLLMLVQTRGIAQERLTDVWYALVLDLILAILIGNLVKGCAVYVSARISNSLGIDFYRRGVTLQGKEFREVYRSDGTWRRCEFSAQETSCEWTDHFGKCRRAVTRPRKEFREAWGRANSK